MKNYIYTKFYINNSKIILTLIKYLLYIIIKK